MSSRIVLMLSRVASSPTRSAISRRSSSSLLTGVTCTAVLAHALSASRQITARGDAWVYDPDISRASEFEVNFREQPDGQTLVELEHRNIDRHGPGAAGI